MSQQNLAMHGSHCLLVIVQLARGTTEYACALIIDHFIPYGMRKGFRRVLSNTGSGCLIWVIYDVRNLLVVKEKQLLNCRFVAASSFFGSIFQAYFNLFQAALFGQTF